MESENVAGMVLLGILAMLIIGVSSCAVGRNTVAEYVCQNQGLIGGIWDAGESRILCQDSWDRSR